MAYIYIYIIIIHIKISFVIEYHLKTFTLVKFILGVAVFLYHEKYEIEEWTFSKIFKIYRYLNIRSIRCITFNRWYIISDEINFFLVFA